MASTYGGVLGFLAFSTVLLREAVKSGNVDAAMVRGVACLFGFAVIGYFIGWAAEIILDDSVQVQIAREIAESSETETK